MKNNKPKTYKPNAEQIWKQLEDVLVPRLRMTVKDRAVYSFLLRHSHLERKRQVRFSIDWLARGVQLTGGPIRESVRRLIWHGVLRMLRRSNLGHVVEVRLPSEVRAIRRGKSARREAAGNGGGINLEEVDFLISAPLRMAIHAREAGACFYCMRRTTPSVRVLDHVVPRVRRGRNSYRNLVSSCLDCNSMKGERTAANFLRWLYRERHLTARELASRLRAVDALTAGKLRPPLPTTGYTGRGRWRRVKDCAA